MSEYKISAATEIDMKYYCGKSSMDLKITE